MLTVPDEHHKVSLLSRTKYYEFFQVLTQLTIFNSINYFALLNLHCNLHCKFCSLHILRNLSEQESAGCKHRSTAFISMESFLNARS